MALKSEPMIPLRNGPVVPQSVVSWLLDLERRGLTLNATPAGRARIEPAASLTRDDRSLIAAHRAAIRAAAHYIEGVSAVPDWLL